MDRSIIFKILKKKEEFLTIEDNKREWLRRILRRYNSDDIYNADETGLFFHMSSNESLAQEPVSETKKVY
ncbi:hypothetical protein C1646_767992 [Rhizophagus diaphanus]|nr:hypothetical protein C1646_767992 [Rhizophagus diaphanus] [Rhizophagus sp. MUCL 43196]